MHSRISGLLCCYFVLYLGQLIAGAGIENQNKQGMIADLECIKHTMQIQYAPVDWKKEYLHWDFDLEYGEAKELIRSKSSITTKEFHQILKQFLGSTQDYHVDITFYSTESSKLPFSIKTIGDKSFVNWIDLMHWSSQGTRLQVGEELIEFDGRPIQEVLNELKFAKGRRADTATDRALADNALTSRLGTSSDPICNGPIVIKTLTSTNETKTYQLQWDYQYEKIRSPFDFVQKIGNYLGKTIEKVPSSEELLDTILKKRCMITPLHQHMVQEIELRPGEIGAAKSFLPLLGFPIWKYDMSLINGAKISWFAYIYQNDQNKPIGYLRIPHYSGENEDFSNLLPIVAYLEKQTEALVIDQLNNPGGYVHFMYQLLSLFSIDPLLVPKHQIAINQQQVMEAVKTLDELELYSSLENEPQKETIQQLQNYYQFIIDEWNQGKVLTQPTGLAGVECIKPHPYVHYTKPILMLINELDFSAGDFTAAILQDNHRALLLGSKTAGAGGAVAKFSFPNRNGIKEISYTDTLAERINLQKIENLGVIPDIEYQITEEDIRHSYRNYRSIINQTIQEMIGDSQ